MFGVPRRLGGPDGMTGSLRRRLARHRDAHAGPEGCVAARSGPEPVFQLTRAASICVQCGEPWLLGGVAPVGWVACRRGGCARRRHPEDRVTAR